MTVVSKTLIVSGGREVDQIRLTFDDTWNGYGKEVVFWREDPALGPYSAPEPTVYEQILSDVGALSQHSYDMLRSLGMVYSENYTRSSVQESSYFIFHFPVELEAGTYFIQCECNIPSVSLGFFKDDTVDVASRVMAVAYNDVDRRTYTVNITAEQAEQIRYIAMYADTAAIRIFHDGVYGMCRQNAHAAAAHVGEHTIGFQTDVMYYTTDANTCTVTIVCNVADNSGFYFGDGKITYFQATANGQPTQDGAYRFTLQNDQALVVDTLSGETKKQICVKNKTDIGTADLILASFYINDGAEKLRGVLPDTINAARCPHWNAKR